MLLVSSDRRNDPAADPEVERVARIFARDDGLDGDAVDDGEPCWRGYVDVAISAIAAYAVLTGG